MPSDMADRARLHTTSKHNLRDNDQTVPNGTDLLSNRFPGSSYLATIIESLRDKTLARKSIIAITHVGLATLKEAAAALPEV
jgi:hypothetical protein